MIINFYRTTDEKNKLSKRLTDKLSLQGVLKESTSIVNPVVTVELTEPPLYNYVEIPSFKRFYFIDEVESVRNNLWKITMSVDVLMSYSSEIKALNVITDASEVVNNSSYLDGDQWVRTVKDSTTIINFANGFNNDGEYILITAGG